MVGLLVGGLHGNYLKKMAQKDRVGKKKVQRKHKGEVSRGYQAGVFDHFEDVKLFRPIGFTIILGEIIIAI